MILPYVAVIITCLCTSVSSGPAKAVCDIVYGSEDCNLQDNVSEKSHAVRTNLCSGDDMPKDAFIAVLDEKNSSSSGVIKVEFKAPSTQCTFKVNLLVNSQVNNAEECNNFEFKNYTDRDIHSKEKYICPKPNNDTIDANFKVKRAVEDESDCKENVVYFYEYVYTGCYALTFVDETARHIIVTKEFLVTEYKRAEVEKPKLQCTYKPTIKNNKLSVEMITISTDISFLADTPSLNLEIHSSFATQNEDVCTEPHVKNEALIEMPVHLVNNAVNKNCSASIVKLDNGSLGKSLECNFLIANKDDRYCLLLKFLDERCLPGTSWYRHCHWLQECHKIEQKNAIDYEEVKNLHSGTVFNDISRTLYFIIFVIILVVIAVLSTICFLYRKHIQRTKSSLNPTIKNEHFEDESNNVLELGTAKSQKEKLVKETGIVLLYINESKEFMEFINEFKNSLKQHTGCDVYDWYAPDLLHDIARVGAYEWVIQMIRRDCRIVWIDTPVARNLFLTYRKNGFDKFKHLKNVKNGHEISDFRDGEFRAIVDFAKRNNQNIEQEYQRHFVVRLELFEKANQGEDPFADLSPHVRYLIPCHLDKLCRQLSVNELYFEDEINEDKVKLKKYLLKETVVSCK